MIDMYFASNSSVKSSAALIILAPAPAAPPVLWDKLDLRFYSKCSRLIIMLGETVPLPVTGLSNKRLARIPFFDSRIYITSPPRFLQASFRTVVSVLSF
jgi:hypothetical protein